MPKIEFDNPFRAPGKWWRGNLHTHSNRSDGELPPRATAERYRDIGYDFLAITDHLVPSEPFEPPPGLLIVPGGEYHTEAGSPPRCWHFGVLGAGGPVQGANGPVDALYASVRKNARFHWLAHPNWSSLVEDDVLDVRTAPAVEVFNGVCEKVIDRGCSEPVWDYALACGARMNALAVDDTHVAEEIGRGWIMLRAEKLALDAVFAALDRGHWYSTTGPQIHDVRLSGNVVSVWCSPARSIKFMARSWDGKCVAARAGSRIESAEYEIKGSETYVRVQVEDENGRKAWTNPLYVTPVPGEGKP